MDTDGDMGPAMLALPNDKWRGVVRAFVHGGGGSKGRTDKGYSTALRAAGYEGTDGAIAVAASRMFSDARLKAAIVEEAQAAMIADIPIALEGQREILADPGHKDRASMIKSVFDRTGLHAVVEERITHEVEVSPQSVERAKQIAQKMGISLAALLGHRIAAQVDPVLAKLTKPEVQDAEFTAAPAPIRVEDVI